MEYENRLMSLSNDIHKRSACSMKSAIIAIHEQYSSEIARAGAEPSQLRQVIIYLGRRRSYRFDFNYRQVMVHIAGSVHKEIWLRSPIGATAK
jgi:hypothetical protein